MTAPAETAATAPAPTNVTAIAAECRRLRITDQRGAEWYLRKQSAYAAEIALVKAQAAARIRELESDAARLAHLYEAQVVEWARGEAEARGSRCVTTLYGTIEFCSDPGDTAAEARVTFAGRLPEPGKNF
jgi:hypothetical protein